MDTFVLYIMQDFLIKKNACKIDIYGKDIRVL